MTALDELFEEMQSTWTADGKCKQLLIERSQLKQALLSATVRQLKPGPILRQGEEYWFSLEDPLVFLLVSQDDQEATPKHHRIVALINRAIEELGGPPPAANPKPKTTPPLHAQNRCPRPGQRRIT